MKLNFDLFGKDVFPSSHEVTRQRQRGDSEVEACRSYFEGKRLSDVQRSSLVAVYQQRYDMSAIPALLSDQAFAFFLPALMQIAIDGQDDHETQVPDLGNILVHHLLEMAQASKGSARLAELLKVYSPTQLGEVARFLRAMRDHEKEMWVEASEWSTAAEALNLYWSQYLVGSKDLPGQ
jgi:hypothetical protein